MADRVSSEVRSRIMRAVRSRNTRPELAVRRFLHAAGLRYRLHGAGLPGKPDVVFPGRRVVLFVHGCFWHQHKGCRRATVPASNQQFWQRKLARNVERDREVRRRLKDAGWGVISFWECQAANVGALRRLAAAVRARPLGRREPSERGIIRGE
jgi:DNA mismatch endonuclease, patch repair protein